MMRLPISNTPQALPRQLRSLNRRATAAVVAISTNTSLRAAEVSSTCCWNANTVAQWRRTMCTTRAEPVARTSAHGHKRPRLEFFSPSCLLHYGKPKNNFKLTFATQATPTTTSKGQDDNTHTPPPPDENAHLPPHRRRQARRKAESTLPANASTILTDVAANHPAHSIRRHLSAFLSLTKPRLTVLVVLTAMAPYALYPVPDFLSPVVSATAATTATTATPPSLSPLTLLFLTTGTALCSASANAFNMLYESATDAKMSRTRNRPLVRRLISTRSAVAFAITSGVVGIALLYYGVNPTVSGLGALNIALYAGAYTPLKAVTVANTWIGAVVGGIPPLMGWAAAAGETATDDGSWRELLLAADGSSVGGWLLGGLLFAWQFPHFMALSWSIRDEYRAAGLRMLAWTNPARNARVALRYSLMFVPLCVGLCAVGVTEWSFAATSLPINGWLAWQAVGFWRQGGHAGSARGLFWASVWHLPAVMVLALLQKKGMWGRVWKSITGGGEEDDMDDDDELWEDDDSVVVQEK